MLDGIRGISILWVILHHLPVPFPSWLESFRIRGNLGVELFFAVSGFLVTRSLYQCIFKAKETDKGTLSIVKDFFVRRVSRIFPPYYLTLTVLSISAIFFKDSLYQKLESISGILWSFPCYAYNYAQFLTNGSVPGSFHIMWSLAFEEQFYLLLLAVFAIWRKGLKTALFVLCIGAIVGRFYQVFFSASNLSVVQIQMYLHLRLDAIMWGCLGWLYFDHIADFLKKNVHSIALQWLLSFALIGVVIFHQWYYTPQWTTIGYFLTSVVFVALILLLAALPNALLSKVFSNRFLAYVGVISYELYLIHEIVIGIFVKSTLTENPFLFSIVCFAVSLLVASAFHHIISKPAQKYIRKISRS